MSMGKVENDSRLITSRSGLAWHTDDNALRAKFEEFGAVEEAVCCSGIAMSARNF